MTPFRFALLAALALVPACSVLGPWPYGDRSHPSVHPAAVEQVPPDTLRSPLPAVCQLATQRRKAHGWLWLRDSPAGGSAALVDGRYLVTAAHNVADYPLWNRVVRIEVRCGAPVASRREPDAVLTRAELVRARALPRYAWRAHARGRSFEFDYAFLDLGHRLDVDDGFVLDAPAAVDPGDAVSLAGYPGGTVSDLDTLHRATGTVTGRHGNLVSYDVATATGNSGGPVWVRRDGAAHLVAVHVGDRVGRLVDPVFLADWRAWRRSIGHDASTPTPASAPSP